MRFHLEDGGLLPAFPGRADTLEILAGRALLVQAGLRDRPYQVEGFLLKVSQASGRLSLRVQAPEPMSLRWSVLSLDGRRLLPGGALSLPTGFYALPLGDAKGAGAIGPALLRLDWISSGKSERRVLRMPP